MRFYVVALLWLIAAALPAAVRRNLTFSQLGLREGLSQSVVFAILKDRQGFLWFATKDGLNRYDGLNFVVFNHEVDDPYSLSFNYVTFLCADRAGNLWVGTEGGGLNRLESGGTRFRHYRRNAQDPGSVSSDNIKAICQDRRGNIWVGTDQGLDCLLSRSDRFIHFRPNPASSGAFAGGPVTFLVPDPAGSVWIGLTDKGFGCYDLKTGRFKHFRRDPQDDQTLDDDSVVAACRGPDGAIWIATNSGLNRFDPRTGKVRRFQLGGKNAVVLGVTVDNQGNVWATTYADGLFCIDAGNGEISQFRYDPNHPEGLNTQALKTVFADDAGMLWVGTNGMGVNKAALEAKQFSNLTHEEGNPQSLGSESIRAIYEGRDDLLYVGGYGGLDCLDRDSWIHFKAYDGRRDFMDNHYVYVICPDDDEGRGVLWIGTEGGGLAVYDPARRTFRSYTAPGLRGMGNEVYSLCKDREGFLWIGTNQGLCRHRPADGSSRIFDLPREAGLDPESSVGGVRCIFADRGGDFWIGTSRSGLFWFQPRSGTWRNFKHREGDRGSLSSDWVTCVYESRAGDLWIGTNGGGLNRLDRTSGLFTRLTTRDGLPNNVVYGILEDEGGYLWTSTNLGVSRFDPRRASFRNYDQKDGLIGNEFNGGAYHRGRWSGQIYFGGISGLTSFHPAQMKDDPHLPYVVITDFKIFNRSVVPGPRSFLKKPISQTTAVTLSYRESMLSFEFIGLHYVAPAKNLYAYRMEGFDREWNMTDSLRRFATYTNLDPGRYTFRVRAANSDGVWNEAGVALAIVITPPFWKTWWFILLSVLGAGLLLASVFRARVNRLEKRKAELELLVEQRTQELREASLRDPLTGLRNRRFIKEILKSDITALVKSKQYLLEHSHRRSLVADKEGFGVFMLDIDHFKEVNDIHGHEAGDNLLVQLSRLLQESVRADDVVVRMGGEEFLLVLKKADPGALALFAKKIKDKVEAVEFDLQTEPPLRAKRTCSIGFTRFPFYQDHPDWLSFEQVISLADLGLYHAKKSGRNAVVHVLPGTSMPAAEEIGRFLSALEENLGADRLRIDLIR